MFHLMNPCSLGYEIRKVQIFPKITKTVIAKPFSLMMSLQIFPSLPSLHVFILDGSRSSCFIQCTTVKLSHLRGPKKSNREHRGRYTTKIGHRPYPTTQYHCPQNGAQISVVATLCLWLWGFHATSRCIKGPNDAYTRRQV